MWIWWVKEDFRIEITLCKNTYCDVTIYSILMLIHAKYWKTKWGDWSVPGVTDGEPSFLGLRSWSSFGGDSSLLWTPSWFRWFCWPSWVHIVGAAGEFVWAQCSITMLSGSVLMVPAPMWLTSSEVADSGFSLSCSCASLHDSEPVLQTTGPFVLGGWPPKTSSARGPLGFLQFLHAITLHLQTGSSADNETPRGASDVVQVLEAWSGEEVLSKEAWGFMSSGVARDLAPVFCSETHSADEGFCLMDRCRMMLHWRAITSWSHCSTHQSNILQHYKQNPRLAETEVTTDLKLI